MDRRGILAGVVTAASGLFAVGAKRAEATAMTPVPADRRSPRRNVAPLITPEVTPPGRRSTVAACDKPAKPHRVATATHALKGRIFEFPSFRISSIGANTRTIPSFSRYCIRVIPK